MARINIKSIIINSDLVSSNDYFKVVVCPFDNTSGDLQEITTKLEKDAAVFTNLTEIVVDYETIVFVHVFTKPRSSSNGAYNYLDTCFVKNISRQNTTKLSEGQNFTIKYSSETLEDMVPKKFKTGYRFQLVSAECIEKEDFSDDEIRFEMTPDDDDSNKKRFPVDSSYYSFKKGQIRTFKKENKSSILFSNKLSVIVWEIDSPDPNDKLGVKEFKPQGPSTENSSFKANRYGADYDIKYEITEVFVEKAVKRENYSWDLSKNFTKLNFQPFFSKMNPLKDKFNNYFSQILVQKPDDKAPSNTTAEQLHHNINPLNSEEFHEVNKFITEYYAEFLTSAQLQEKYIEELTHTQYPVMAYPVFPEPAYYYLKQLSQRFILPSSGAMPDNSMAIYTNNPAFVEAFLCGMNTEMGRELLWREYPTDCRGSYFRKFWDTEVKKIIKDELHEGTFFDILPIHKWEHQEVYTHHVPHNPHKLGQNHMPGKDNLLIFAIKGELLKKYPETLIYLSKASLEGNKVLINPDAEKILPDLSAWLGEDTFIVGFPADLEELAGNPTTRDPGYFLTFMNRPGETRFGIDGINNEKSVEHAGENAANLLVKPYIFGKHVSQFLK